jgi:hypothetical protein
MFERSIYRILVLNTASKCDSLHMMIFVNICSTWSLVQLKTRFVTWITRNDVIGVSLFHLSYLITLKAYLCSQVAPNVQIKCLMFDWSICRLFVLNWVWKRDSFQIMIFAYVSSAWCIVELKTRIETRITRNDLNGVSLSYLSDLITIMAHNEHQISKSIILCLISRSPHYLC